jgi:hypothetical protein
MENVKEIESGRFRFKLIEAIQVLVAINKENDVPELVEKINKLKTSNAVKISFEL